VPPGAASYCKSPQETPTAGNFFAHTRRQRSYARYHDRAPAWISRDVIHGTFWFYNNWDFNVLGTIFEKKTGMKIGEAFYKRIALPIGMQDFRPEDVYYLGGTVSVHSAYHFEMTARDLARFGLLYLRQGRWNNLQIVPESWIEKSTHANEMIQIR
jgi:CubicO group peptidase (beta-lactamase class C family)